MLFRIIGDGPQDCGDGLRRRFGRSHGEPELEPGSFRQSKIVLPGDHTTSADNVAGVVGYRLRKP